VTVAPQEQRAHKRSAAQTFLVAMLVLLAVAAGTVGWFIAFTLGRGDALPEDAWVALAAAAVLALPLLAAAVWQARLLGARLVRLPDGRLWRYGPGGPSATVDLGRLDAVTAREPRSADRVLELTDRDGAHLLVDLSAWRDSTELRETLAEAARASGARVDERAAAWLDLGDARGSDEA